MSSLDLKKTSTTTKPEEKDDVVKKEKVVSFDIEEKVVCKEEEWDGSIDSSVIHGAINISKNGLGAVSLFIAGGFYEGGLVFGGFILVISCILSATSFFIVGKCCHLTNSSSYADIFKCAFGEHLGWICSMIIGLFTTNILVLYVLILGMFSQGAFDHWHLLNWIPNDDSGKVWKNIFLIALIAFTIAIPLAFLKHLKYFKYTSSFGLFSLIYACLLHFFVASLGMNEKPESGQINMGPRGVLNSVIFFATFIGGFNCHFNAANYYKSTGCNIKKFRLIIMISFSFMFCINMVMGYSAFFNNPAFYSKHSDPPSIVLFNGSKNSSLQAAGILGCLFIGLNIAFGFGLVGFATRLSLNEFLNFLGSKFEMCSRFRCAPQRDGVKDDPEMDAEDTTNSSSLIIENETSLQAQTDTRHVPLTCTVIAIVLGIASILLGAAKGNPDVSVSACCLALNIAVAVFGTNVALTMPGFIYYKILIKQKDYKMTTLDYAIVSSLIGVGSFASIAGIAKLFISAKQLN